MTLPETVSKIRLAEVRTALRGLEAGPYPVRDLYWKYIEACRAAGYAGGHLKPFGRAMTVLGVPPMCRYDSLGENGRWVDPEALGL